MLVALGDPKILGEGPMPRIVLLGGALAMLMAAGATALAFETVSPQRVAPAKPIHPAPLSTPWQNSQAPLIKPWQDSRDEMALP
jgi:hypothetical protein